MRSSSFSNYDINLIDWNLILTSGWWLWMKTASINGRFDEYFKLNGVMRTGMITFE